MARPIRSLESLHNQHNEADNFRVMKRRATGKRKRTFLENIL